MNDCQEAIHADAREEEDAAIHIGVEQGHWDLAESFTERPLTIDEVERPERQAEDKEGIRGHEVHHVRRGLVAHFQSACKNVHGRHVEEKPQNKDDTESRAV